MSEAPFSNREISQFHEEMKVRMDKFESSTTNSLSSIEPKMDKGFTGVHLRQDKANHKVSKIIIALVFAFGLIIGLGFVEVGKVVPLLL